MMIEVPKISKNVAIVDDDPAIRRSLKWLVESIGLVVETYESAQAFLDSENRSLYGCLILDMRMPGMSGLDLLENRPEDMKMPVIVITGYGEVPTAVRAMKAGAFDFIEKPFNDQMLIDRVNQALDTHSRESASFSRRHEILERLKSLTPRETEVVELIVQGLPNKQIAVKLGLSEKTVEVHRARVMQKMKAENVATLVRIVLTATQGDVPPQYTPS